MLADILGYVSKNPTTIASLKLDIVKQVSYSYEQEVTEHPVEVGYEIHDTIINKPLRVEITAGVSSRPITWFWKNGLGVKKFSDAKTALIAIRNAKQPITIVRPDGVLTDMVMISCKFGSTDESMSVMMVELAFVKIVKVDVATVAIPQDIVDKSIKDSAGETAQSGGTATQAEVKAGSTTAEKTESVRKSILAEGADAVGKLGKDLGIGG